MNRIWIIGCSGSGKSTLARSLSDKLVLPWHELDGIFHQANWTQMPDELFCDRLAEIVATESWILDGNYFNRCPGMIAERAELVVWLDLPRTQTFIRVVTRSIRRLTTNEELWNGNRENLSSMLSPNPKKNIVLNTWWYHPTYRKRYEKSMANLEFGGAKVVRLQSSSEVATWLRSQVAVEV